MWMKFCLTSEETLLKDWGNFCPYSADVTVTLARGFPAVRDRALFFSWNYQDLDYPSTKQAEISCSTHLCFKGKWRVIFDSWYFQSNVSAIPMTAMRRELVGCFAWDSLSDLKKMTRCSKVLSIYPTPLFQDNLFVFSSVEKQALRMLNCENNYL